MADDQPTDMSSEYARLASFGGNTMDVAAVMSTSTSPGCWNLRFNSPMKCAKAGFYCVPGSNGDVLSCFACSAEWTNPQGESPLAVHRVLSPNCPYLKSATPFSTAAPLIFPKSHINNARRCLFPLGNENINFTTENNNYLYKFQDHQQVKRNQTFTPIGGSDFLFESRRFLTFDNLTNENILKASEWAANGFIFQQSYMVQCVFCGLTLPFTTELSTCKLQHEQEAAHCPLVMKHDVGNITIQMENAVNWMKETKQLSSVEMSLVFVHPQFEDINKRRDTFREWPSQMYQKPEELCEAGFYYTGCADKVICFCCGLGVKSWRDQADPWIQHARLSPQCRYLKEIRGNNFVQDAQQAEVQADFDPPKTFQEGPVLSDGTVTTTSPVRPGLDLNVIKAALECGFPNFPLLIGELLADEGSRKMMLDLLKERQEKKRERQEKERERQEKERERLRGQQLEEEKEQLEEEKERERQEKERERLRGQQLEEEKEQLEEEKEQLEEEKERERQEKERERLRGQQLEEEKEQLEEEKEQLEEEKERERQEKLQLEQAQQQMYANVLRMALEKQNWQTRFREEEERRRREEERRRQEEERRRQEEERHVTELSRQEEELQRLRAEIIRLKAAQNVLISVQGVAAPPQDVAAPPQNVAAPPQNVAAPPQNVAAPPPLPIANLAPQCITCLQEPATALFLPCSHLCCGVQCSQHFLMKPCPMCRQVVQERKIIYIA
ncbi:capping protein inhibiting regulator of actin dynamics-like isoform X2 [Gigantopelta aegis]|uniref:capping protein inhibiting regulator of actin dynamics-like isoform X2 n=1 Tax=Gigantopelta aegis TaxID=1735272 RepID=UPI001B88984A|nr:capping protein inhibiting regulator of actin dynamics-like isoform X2 [Gigantopelta aegis]